MDPARLEKNIIIESFLKIFSFLKNSINFIFANQLTSINFEKSENLKFPKVQFWFAISLLLLVIAATNKT